MAHFCNHDTQWIINILGLKYKMVWKLQNFSILMSHLEKYYPILEELLDFGLELEWCKLSIIDLKLHHILDIWSQWQRNDTKINSSRSDLFWLFKRRLLVISLLTLYMCLGLNNPLILTQYVDRWVCLVMRFLTVYDTWMSVSCY